ncbi:MAG: hypothetical protein ACYDHX_03100 [Methanothrix sp.]
MKSAGQDLQDAVKLLDFCSGRGGCRWCGGASPVTSQNRRLRRELEKGEANLRELETQVFKLQHASFLSDTKGQKIYSEKLIKILRSGGVWPGPSAMKS